MNPAGPLMGYRQRLLDIELDQLLPQLAAIAIDGAKGVGKTKTAAQRAATVFELDDPQVLEVARADPRRLLTATPPVLLDEWQRLPALWDLVRRDVDAKAPAGRYLLTGSAARPSPGTHSGAGRIVRLRMRPMTLSERGVGTAAVSLAELLRGTHPNIYGTTHVALEDYAREICASGLPALRGLTGRPLRVQLDGYIDRVIDRDLAELEHPVRNPAALRRWMAAYAAASSTLASYDRIRDAATGGEGDKPAKTTTMRYRDALERLWLLDPIPAWTATRSHFARLAAAPKHQLVDPALAARLLGADVEALINSPAQFPTLGRDTTLLGQLFESLVALDVRVYAQAAEARVAHFRSHIGDHEVDLIVERGDQRVVALEVKLAATVDERDVRHLKWLRKQLGDELLDAAVITTGSHAYRRGDGIAVIPAGLLGP